MDPTLAFMSWVCFDLFFFPLFFFCFAHAQIETGKPGVFAVFAAEFFGKQVAVYYVEKGEVVGQHTIDGAEGEMYDVRVTSLFGADGPLYVISDNYKYFGSGTAWMYRMAGAFGNFTFTKTVLASGFDNKQVR